jgi:hypothetical protein
MFSGKFIKKNGKLIYASPEQKLAYEIFVEKLPEGQAVEMYIDLANINHSKAQLAKIHACIRELAKESGYTFDEMKCLVKDHAGLAYKEGMMMTYKSFADCSKDELMLAIEACIQIGREQFNINLG